MRCYVSLALNLLTVCPWGREDQKSSRYTFTLLKSPSYSLLVCRGYLERDIASDSDLTQAGHA